MAIFLKDPAATIDYAVDWTANLAAGRTITEVLWRVEPAHPGGVTVDASVIEPTRAVATLSGGANGLVYHVINQVTFSDGRSDERTLVLRVEDQ